MKFSQRPTGKDKRKLAKIKSFLAKSLAIALSQRPTEEMQAFLANLFSQVVSQAKLILKEGLKKAIKYPPTPQAGESTYTFSSKKEKRGNIQTRRIEWSYPVGYEVDLMTEIIAKQSRPTKALMFPEKAHRPLDRESTAFLKKKGQGVKIYDVSDEYEKCQVIDNKRVKND